MDPSIIEELSTVRTQLSKLAETIDNIGKFHLVDLYLDENKLPKRINIIQLRI